MFLRLLTLIAVLIGLCANPVLARGECSMSAPMEACGCCPPGADEACCEPDSAPAGQSTTLANGFSSEWKRMVEPVVTAVPKFFEEARGPLPGAPRRCSVSVASVSLERICIRLV